MSLVTYPTYVRLTGDSTSASSDVMAAMDDATDLLEDCLNRTLRHGTYTETVRVSPSGHAYPRAVPITAIPAGAAYESVNPYELRFVSPSQDPSFDVIDWPYLDADGSYPALWPRVSLQYDGAYTEATLPFSLKRAICLIANKLLTDPTASALSGSWSRSVGDVSESHTATANEAETAIDAIVPGLWATIRGRRRRTY